MGIPSDSAFLQVDRPGEPAGDYLSLRVPTSGDENPLLELREEYEAWRATHPCPEPEPGTGGSAGMGSTGGGGTGGANSAGSGAGGGGNAGQPSAGSAGTGGSPRGADGEAIRSEDAGCSCRAAAQRSSWPVPFVLLLALAERRVVRVRPAHSPTCSRKRPE
jgi:MYXO-CTERM domain-containing protein